MMFYDYYCIVCHKIIESSDAPIVSGPLICGHCGAKMTLDEAPVRDVQ